MSLVPNAPKITKAVKRLLRSILLILTYTIHYRAVPDVHLMFSPVEGFFRNKLGYFFPRYFICVQISPLEYGAS